MIFDINVKDETIAKRTLDPWTDDCVEFFFDTCPLSNIGRRRYTREGQFRLFIRPAATDGKADISTMGKVDKKQIKWSADRVPGGFRVKVSLPLPENSTFDLSLDNSTPTRTQTHWSTKEFSYLYRDGFGAML